MAVRVYGQGPCVLQVWAPHAAWSRIEPRLPSTAREGIRHLGHPTYPWELQRPHLEKDNEDNVYLTRLLQK